MFGFVVFLSLWFLGFVGFGFVGCWKLCFVVLGFWRVFGFWVLGGCSGVPWVFRICFFVFCEF